MAIDNDGENGGMDLPAMTEISLGFFRLPYF